VSFSGSNPPFRDLTIEAFVDRLSSDEPVPGGGSASAIAASLGAALVSMVARLSEGRERYAAHAATHARAGDVGRRLSARFFQLADEDAAAFAVFGVALKMPRATDEEKAVRTQAIRAAARTAADVPLACVEACLELDRKSVV
jgi:formiminotetrahydrofolate cyclodeaminase